MQSFQFVNNSFINNEIFLHIHEKVLYADFWNVFNLSFNLVYFYPNRFLFVKIYRFQFRDKIKTFSTQL